MNDPPAYLYKYLSPHRVHSSATGPSDLFRIIRRGEIFIPSPLQFNDPYDCVPAADTDSTFAEQKRMIRRSVRRRMREQPRYTRLRAAAALEPMLTAANFGSPEANHGATDALRMILRNIGVYSLTSDPLNLLMWGHYASSHTGICLRFDTSTEHFLSARRVNYSNERPKLRPFSTRNAEQAAEAMLWKALDWGYEKEWRIITSKHTGWTPVGFAKVTSVILGALISESDADLVRAVVRASEHPCCLQQARLDLREYRMHLEPD